MIGYKPPKQHHINVPCIRDKRIATKVLTVSYAERGNDWGILSITDERKKPVQYRCLETATPGVEGRTFVLTKVDESCYNVLVHWDLQQCVCDCIAGDKGTACKHVLSLRYLIQERILKPNE